jgi:hypothetical protein
MTRALRKDPNIIKKDTVVVDRIIEGDSGKVFGFDSAMVDNERLYIKAIGRGKIDLSYILKDFIIHDTVTVTNVVIPPTRQQVRQQGKTDRKKAVQEGKTDRKIIQKDKALGKKKIKEEGKNEWNYFWAGFCTCLGVMVLLYFVRKRFFP